MVKPPPLPLSPKMSRAVEAVQSLTTAKGYPPSAAEVGERLGIGRVTSWRLLRAAADRGAVTFDVGVSRSWRVTKPPAENKKARSR